MLKFMNAFVNIAKPFRYQAIFHHMKHKGLKKYRPQQVILWKPSSFKVFSPQSTLQMRKIATKIGFHLIYPLRNDSLKSDPVDQNSVAKFDFHIRLLEKFFKEYGESINPTMLIDRPLPSFWVQMRLCTIVLKKVTLQVMT